MHSFCLNNKKLKKNKHTMIHSSWMNLKCGSEWCRLLVSLSWNQQNATVTLSTEWEYNFKLQPNKCIVLCGFFTVHISIPFFVRSDPPNTHEKKLTTIWKTCNIYTHILWIDSVIHSTIVTNLTGIKLWLVCFA